MFLTSVAGSRQVHTTIFWLMGNMTEEPFAVLWIGGGCVAAAVAALYLLGPQLNALSFGRADAKSLGVNTSKVAMASFAIAAFVTAVAVSLSGLIGFVGLIVPHAVRLLFGPDHRQLVPISAAAGAMFLAAADTVARTAVAPAQLPVGVVTAIVGGPFFLFLLIKHAKRVWG
jgi:iron complex transport system permease protein